VIAFGALITVRYWDLVRQNEDLLYLGFGLFLAMVAGMFAQVLSSNRRSGNSLFSVSDSQLVFPLLFSIVVFYPTWIVVASAPHSFFSVYAAFVNGYFWESTVSAVRPPEPDTRR
jgi:hypothetical protein